MNVEVLVKSIIQKKYTYAGQPMAIATTARTVSPFPNPSLEYIAGANNGNPQPANERRKDTAASAMDTKKYTT